MYQHRRRRFRLKRNRRRGYRIISLIAVIAVIVQAIYPIIPFLPSFGDKKPVVFANDDILSTGDTEKVMFQNTNPNFKVEFGNKEKNDKPFVRFEALGSGDNPFAREKNETITEGILERLSSYLYGDKKSGIEFSLREAGTGLVPSTQSPPQPSGAGQAVVSRQSDTNTNTNTNDHTIENANAQTNTNANFNANTNTNSNSNKNSKKDNKNENKSSSILMNQNQNANNNQNTNSNTDPSVRPSDSLRMTDSNSNINSGSFIKKNLIDELTEKATGGWESTGEDTAQGSKPKAESNSGLQPGDYSLEQSTADRETLEIEAELQAEEKIYQELQDHLDAMINDADWKPDQSVDVGKRRDELKQQIFNDLIKSQAAKASTEKTQIDNPEDKNSKKDVIKNPNIVTGVDTEYQIMESKGLKEEIVIRSNEGFIGGCSLKETENGAWKMENDEGKECSLPKNEFTFDLKLDPGVKMEHAIGTTNSTPHGITYFTDDKGKYLFHFLPLFAVDASGERTNAVRLEITESSPPSEGGEKEGVNNKTIQQYSNVQHSYTMKVVVDLAWLLDPARVFPIRVDPSIVHDTEVEFDAGNALNRVESLSDPKVDINNPSGGNDTFTKLLLHADGADASTTFTDSEMPVAQRKTVTANGNAHVEVDQSKFGGSSAYFDGTGDYLSVPANSNWDFGGGNFTVDFWVWRNGDQPDYAGIVSGDTNTVGWVVTWGFAANGTTNKVSFLSNASGVHDWDLQSSTAVANQTWTHIAVVRNGNTLTMYQGGTSVDSASVAGYNYNSGGAGLSIGRLYTQYDDYYHNGYVDEARVSKGIARWTNNFTAPAKPYDFQKPYGQYDSSVLDLTSGIQTIDSLVWTENGAQTGDGETEYSSANLVAEWDFNEASGTTATNNAGAGTCGGTATDCDFTLNNFASTGSRDAATMSGWTADNLRWGAGAIMLSSAATADTLSLADIAGNVLDPNSSDMTIEYWIKTTDVGGEIFSNNNNDGGGFCGNNGYFLGITNGYPSFFLDINGGTAGCDVYITNTNYHTTINDGNWHHVAVSVTRGSNANMYVDGVLVASDDVSSYSGITVTGNIYMGNFAALDGVVDALKFYTRALSGNEILSNYQAGNIEFETRTGADNSPDDGSWEEWRPVTSEAALAAMDADQANWSWDGAATYMPQLKSDESNIKMEGSGSMKQIIGAPQDSSADVVGLWHMDETGGTGAYIHDTSGNTNDGTPTGTTLVDGVAGKARSFDGSNDVVNVGTGATFDFGNDGAFTASGWVKPTTLVDSMAFVNKSAANRAGSVYSWMPAFMANGRLEALSDTPAWVDVCPAGSLAIGIWQHVAFSFNGTNITGYVNGASCGSVAYSYTDYAAHEVTIGSWYAAATTYDYSGLIDEVKLSNTGRTAEDIYEEYRMGRDHRVAKTISSADLTTETKLPFYVAGDRAGSYLEATVGESAYANYETDANTVGLWHLEESAGSGAYIQDSSASGFDGTPSGATYSDGKIGKARSFDGNDDYVVVIDNAALTPANNTTEAWIKYNSLGTDDYFVGKNGEYALVYNFAATNCTANKFGFALFSGGTWACASSATTPVVDQWYHVVGTYDGTNIRIYINGVLEGGPTAKAVYSDTAGTFDMGGASGGAGYTIAGVLDEVRLSDAVRSASDIRQAFEVGKRTHPITIDFQAKLDSGNLIADTSDLSFTVDARPYLSTTNQGENLYIGDKIIVKENYDGTEYIAQGTVTAITQSSGATTVAAWDAGSTAPAAGFTANASVFKWQREMMDVTGPLNSQVDAVVRLTLRCTDGSEGRAVYLDDFRSGGEYLSTSPETTDVTSADQRYMQYRAFFSTTDPAVTPYLSGVTVNYTAGPTNEQIMRHGMYFTGGAKQAFWWAR